jgi:hypothetical protein
MSGDFKQAIILGAGFTVGVALVSLLTGVVIGRR